jgi:hypothetical protein
MPDGSFKEIEDTHHWKFIVITKDPEYRLLAKCSSRKEADNRYSYFVKCWGDAITECPIWIIPRNSFEYIYDGPGYDVPEPMPNLNWNKIGD